jgi:hypothetical protein
VIDVRTSIGHFFDDLPGFVDVIRVADTESHRHLSFRVRGQVLDGPAGNSAIRDDDQAVVQRCQAVVKICISLTVPEYPCATIKSPTLNGRKIKDQNTGRHMTEIALQGQANGKS